MLKPIITVQVSLTENRDIAIGIQRHALDRLEVLAAAGALQATIFEAAKQVLNAQLVPPPDATA